MLHQIDSLFDFLYHTKLRPALDILRTHQITVKSQLVCPPLLDTSLVAHRHHSSTAKRKCSAAPPQPGLQKAPRNDVTLSKQPVIPPIPPLCLEPTIFPAVSSTEIEYLYLDSLVPEDAKLCGTLVFHYFHYSLAFLAFNFFTMSKSISILYTFYIVFTLNISISLQMSNSKQSVNYTELQCSNLHRKDAMLS